jgi:hypothetical protein
LRLPFFRLAARLGCVLASLTSAPLFAWVNYECADSSGRVVARTNLAVTGCSASSRETPAGLRANRISAKPESLAPTQRKNEQISIILAEFRATASRLHTLEAANTVAHAPGGTTPVIELQRLRIDLQSLREELARLGVRAPAPGSAAAPL